MKSHGPLASAVRHAQPYLSRARIHATIAPRSTRLYQERHFRSRLGPVDHGLKFPALGGQDIDARRTGTHDARILPPRSLKPSHRAHMPFSFWMALAGTVRQSWRSNRQHHPAQTPALFPELIPDLVTVCSLFACQQARHDLSSTIMSGYVDWCCEAWNFFANDKTAMHVNRYQTLIPKRSTTRADEWYNSTKVSF